MTESDSLAVRTRLSVVLLKQRLFFRAVFTTAVGHECRLLGLLNLLRRRTDVQRLVEQVVQHRLEVLDDRLVTEVSRTDRTLDIPNETGVRERLGQRPL